MEPIALLYVTYPSADAARAAATALLDARLAACCNILPAMESHYRWEGSTTSASEYVMLVKTTAARTEAACARIAELHPYQCPAILTLSASAMPAFAAWIDGTCTS
jgi:periplasmic divalent cation tolerance protein